MKKRPVKNISVVMPFYNQPLMLRHQLFVFNAYPADLRERLHLILVDDGSRDMTAIDVIKVYGIPNLGSLRLFRTAVDVPWNQEFAVNLGVFHVETRWFAHIDLDHEMPERTFSALVHKDYDEETAYRFSRVWSSNGRERALHEALFFMTATMFHKAGGLEERFAGAYLPSDRDFAQRLVNRGGATIAVLPQPLITHDEDDGLFPDASSIRSTPHIVSEEGERRYREILEERGDGAPLTLSYPWEQIL